MVDFRVLANDGLEESGIKILEESGISMDVKKRNPEQLVDEVGKFNGLIVRSATKVTKDVIDAGYNGKLVIVGRAGVGYDNVDVPYATQKGVIVKTAPYGNTNSTAELALGLMFALARKIPQSHLRLNLYELWEKKSFLGRELSGKNLGIIGVGRIGRRLAQLTRGFMEVTGYDVCENPEAEIRYVSKEELLKNSDFVSIHISGKEQILGKNELALMRPSAYVVNLSRGKSLDNEALYEALITGKIAGAGLDVHLDEPAKDGEKFKSRFSGLENVVLTPHLGASTSEAQMKTGAEIATVVRDYLLKGNYSGAVNAREGAENGERQKREVYRLYIHNQNVPGVFGKIDSLLGGSEINIRETVSGLMTGESSANAVYILDNPVDESVLRQLNSIEGVYRARAV